MSNMSPEGVLEYEDQNLTQGQIAKDALRHETEFASGKEKLDEFLLLEDNAITAEEVSRAVSKFENIYFYIGKNLKPQHAGIVNACHADLRKISDKYFAMRNEDSVAGDDIMVLKNRIEEALQIFKQYAA